MPTEALDEASQELDVAADNLRRRLRQPRAAKEEAWLADCGRDGAILQERAAKLAGLSAAENPDFASSITWEPQVGLDRARSYYRARLEQEAPEGSSVEEQANSAPAHFFYQYALEELEGAAIVETEDGVVSTVPLLPRNTDEVRATSLYTMPCGVECEADGITLHYSSSCPGATGASGPTLALSGNRARWGPGMPCVPLQRGDVGKTPAASTSIAKRV